MTSPSMPFILDRTVTHLLLPLDLGVAVRDVLPADDELALPPRSPRSRVGFFYTPRFIGFERL